MIRMSIQPNIHTGEYDTLMAWADIVVKMWQEQIMKMDVWESGSLYDSFVQHVMTQSNGDIQKVSFFFNVYGMYVNHGVGKEIYVGNPGDLGFTPKRKRKRWYSRVFYKEVLKIIKYVNWKYSKAGLEIINEAMSKEEKSNLEEALSKFDFSYWKKHYNL